MSFMSKKVGMISLGCPKNQVDGEIMLSKLADNGFEITNDVDGADVVIVNTCGFIEDAKKEAIENILDMVELKKEGVIRKIVVTGCLAERYRDEVLSEIPEVDAVVGIGSNSDICEVCEKVCGGEENIKTFGEKTCLPLDGKRMLTTPSYYAYIKIGEGCSNNCTYCAIPSIRGKYRSRTPESILEEAKTLVDGGVKELIVVAQDTTRYGEDLFGKCALPALLTSLSKIEGLEWIRVLYLYPERLSDEIIDTFANNDKIVKYMDIPIQHCNSDILRRMNRRGSKEELTALITKIREKIPDVVLRTTLITGFPGETEEQFSELSEFVKEMKFDRLGCFAYSAEENTVAAKMDGQIEQEVKDKRAELVMQIQTGIMAQKQAEKVGQTVHVLCDGIDEENGLYLCRTTGDAPEVDGCVCVSSEEPLYPGQFYDVLVEDSDLYDLYGTVVK